MVSADGRHSVRGLSSATGISRGTVWKILEEDLKMKRKCARFVPHLLTEEQKHFRRTICEQNLTLMRQNPAEFLGKVVTGDETWIANYEPETKRQSSCWFLADAPPKKACRMRGKIQSMLTVFFDFQGIIHVEFLEPCVTIDLD